VNQTGLVLFWGVHTHTHTHKKPNNNNKQRWTCSPTALLRPNASCFCLVQVHSRSK